MAISQIISRLQNHIHDVIPTQAMRNAEVASRIANRRDNTLIQTRKASTGRVGVPMRVILSPFAGDMFAAPSTNNP